MWFEFKKELWERLQESWRFPKNDKSWMISFTGDQVSSLSTYYALLKLSGIREVLPWLSEDHGETVPGEWAACGASTFAPHKNPEIIVREHITKDEPVGKQHVTPTSHHTGVQAEGPMCISTSPSCSKLRHDGSNRPSISFPWAYVPKTFQTEVSCRETLLTELWEFLKYSIICVIRTWCLLSS